MKTPNYINKLASEIATEIVEHRIGSHLTWERDKNGDFISFTDEAQDLFTELYDIVRNKLIEL
tara:strand:- start:963 stop:1151 length:189 start_codon:yes stop_codon:yes gene_type:complete